MKIYKFRPLASKNNADNGEENNSDFSRLKEILKTGKFWCSKFQDLNDPMEGVYRFLNYTENRSNLIDLIFMEKESYKICSFSGEEAFSDPRMWGYYANGFRGVAIEIEVSNDEIEKISYEETIPRSEGLSYEKEAKKILTTKLSLWNHEQEYRFLSKNNGNQHKIGKITSLYFGDPYERAKNRSRINENSETIKEYLELKEKILIITREKNIPVYSVKIANHKVVVPNYKVIKIIADNQQKSH